VECALVCFWFSAFHCRAERALRIGRRKFLYFFPIPIFNSAAKSRNISLAKNENHRATKRVRNEKRKYNREQITRRNRRITMVISVLNFSFNEITVFARRLFRLRDLPPSTTESKTLKKFRFSN